MFTKFVVRTSLRGSTDLKEWGAVLGKQLLLGRMPFMAEVKNKCMICGKEVIALKGGICDPCQDRIRREALGEQAGISDRADRELGKHGVPPSKK